MTEYCLRYRHAAPHSRHNPLLCFTYLVSGVWIMRTGRFAEAQRFATKKLAKAALRKLGRTDLIAISVETAERDEAGLQTEPEEVQS